MRLTSCNNAAGADYCLGVAPELLRLQNENAMLKKNFAAAKREVDRLKKTVASNSSRSTYGVSSVSQASSSKTVPLPSSSQGIARCAVGLRLRADLASLRDPKARLQP